MTNKLFGLSLLIQAARNNHILDSRDSHVELFRQYRHHPVRLAAGVPVRKSDVSAAYCLMLLLSCALSWSSYVYCFHRLMCCLKVLVK